MRVTSTLLAVAIITALYGCGKDEDKTETDIAATRAAEAEQFAAADAASAQRRKKQKIIEACKELHDTVDGYEACLRQPPPLPAGDY